MQAAREERVPSTGATLETIVPLLVPLITGIVAAVGLALKDHRLHRDQRVIRDRALADASAEVAFARDWWKAHQLIGTQGTEELTQQAQRWLTEAEAKVTSAQEMPMKHRRRVTLRRLLLLYPMHGPIARIVKVFFLIGAVTLLLVSVVLVADSFDSSQRKVVLDDITFTITLALAVLLLRAWAVASDRPEHPAPKVTAPDRR